MAASMDSLVQWPRAEPSVYLCLLGYLTTFAGQSDRGLPLLQLPIGMAPKQQNQIERIPHGGASGLRPRQTVPRDPRYQEASDARYAAGRAAGESPFEAAIAGFQAGSAAMAVPAVVHVDDPPDASAGASAGAGAERAGGQAPASAAPARLGFKV